jgi:hypothetical protein
MNKDKVFELRIEEDDDISGIDSISLVDEPAIEVNWMFFNKEKSHSFEGDDVFVKHLMDKGESEEDMLAQGWVINKITYINGPENFVYTDPNGPSMEDEKEYNVRYKYILNPNISGPAIIDTSRPFCRELIAQNKVFRVEDIESAVNDFGESPLVYRGSFNCRHVWSRIEYKKDATIVNKASVNKGKVEVGGFPSGLEPDVRVLGYDEPSTVTKKTLNNPSPSTVRNLGLSKEKMEIMPPNVNVYGYHTRFFQICPGAQATFEHLISMDNDDDTIGMIRSAAQVADNVFRIEDEVIKAESATKHQYEEAVILVDDFKDIIAEVDKISGMKHDVSYMDGHIEKIKEYLKEDLGYDNTLPPFVDEIGKKIKCKECGWEWNLKDGGDKPYKCNKCGYDASSQFQSYTDYPDSVKNNAKAVLKWVEENGWGSCGTEVGKIRANQLANGEPISEETIQRMYSYLSRHKVDLDSSKSYDDGCGKLMYDSWGGLSALSWAESKINSFEKNNMSIQRFQTDEEKKIVIGPAMVPDLKIFRKDKKGNPYHVYFSADTIKMIAEKYMKNKYIDNNDENHNGSAVKDVYVIESWIKEDTQDKSNKYGYGDLPIGTWFVSMKIKNDEIWNKVKQGELNGFSVSGYFEEVAEFCREEMFLKQVAEILKNIED